jgi:hypothetical protein
LAALANLRVLTLNLKEKAGHRIFMQSVRGTTIAFIASEHSGYTRRSFAPSTQAFPAAPRLFE